MDRNEYGPEFSAHLLEQYKLYVELTDNVSERRLKTNSFYISLMSGMLGLLAIGIEKNFFQNQEGLIFIVFGLLGIMLSFLWRVNIRSYRQLNSGRFKVIHEMEAMLPYACFDREWKFLSAGEDPRQYFQLTRVENFIPLFLGIPYLILLLYGIVLWST